MHGPLKTTRVKMPIMHAVRSSNIAQIGYSKFDFELHVKFINGNHYVYRSVGQDTFNHFLHATSPGRFFADHVRSRFSYYQMQQDQIVDESHPDDAAS